MLENQPIPPGLHVKLDIKTGQKFARLLDITEKTKRETEYMTQQEKESWNEVEEAEGSETGPFENYLKKSKSLGLSSVPINRDAQQLHNNRESVMEDSQKQKKTGGTESGMKKD